jgi:hypothetical protein
MPFFMYVVFLFLSFQGMGQALLDINGLKHFMILLPASTLPSVDIRNNLTVRIVQ